MRVLVTGRSGFTGRYLSQALTAAGHEVLPFDAEITDPIAVNNSVRQQLPDSVVHLAAKAFVYSDDISSFYSINQLGAFNLLDAISRYIPGAPVLIASSANVYGNMTGGLLTEESPTNPANHYAVSKLSMELGARLWTDRLPITIARPFNYTGRDQEQKYVISKIVDHFRRRAPTIELGNIDVFRDFGDVRSVVAAYVGLLEGHHTGTFNVCTGCAFSLSEIIELCVKLTNHRPTIEVNKTFVRPNDIQVLVGSPSKLNSALPSWRPIPLEATLDWMLSDVMGWTTSTPA